jgi:AcrR family transcriptional regulator
MATTSGARRSLETPAPPEIGPGGRRKRRPDRHTEILVAAVDLLDQQDYHSTTLEQIAQRIGLTPASVYRHFRNKQAILDAAAEWATVEVMGRVGDGRHPDGSLPTSEELVDGVVQVLEQAGPLLSILERHLHAISPEVRRGTLERTLPYAETWDLVLAEERPELSPAERGVTIHGVLSMLASGTTAHAGPRAAAPVLRRLALAALHP